MKRQQLSRKTSRKGVLTFEWMLLLVMLTLGIVGGLAIMRDAVVVESAETAGAVMAVNPSYSLQGSLKMKLKSGSLERTSASAKGSSYNGGSPDLNVKVYNK